MEGYPASYRLDPSTGLIAPGQVGYFKLDLAVGEVMSPTTFDYRDMTPFDESVAFSNGIVLLPGFGGKDFTFRYPGQFKLDASMSVYPSAVGRTVVVAMYVNEIDPSSGSIIETIMAAQWQMYNDSGVRQTPIGPLPTAPHVSPPSPPYYRIVENLYPMKRYRMTFHTFVDARLNGASDVCVGLLTETA